MLGAHHDSAYRFLADRHRGPLWAPLRLALRTGLAARYKIAVRRARSVPGAPR
jgi:N-acetylglucosaminyl-diphospho-decaprenol L-rhamnosyltransferase